MTDYFAVFDEPRRPWLDSDRLKEKFLSLSANLHPDRVHSAGAAEKAKAQERYAELNAAYQCLREPKERLRHLLELERGGKLEQVQNIPSPLMDVSLEVGRACREADVFLVEKGKATSPLLQVEIFERGQERVEHLTGLVKQLEARRESLMTELKQIDSSWVQDPATDPGERRTQLSGVEEIYRLLSYYERWNGHLRERIVQLSL
jgi:Fe-S protein assembly co-chaperone HscB